jgi:hypothetical protein
MGKASIKVILLIALGIAFLAVIYYQFSDSEFFGGENPVSASLGRMGKRPGNPVKYDVPALRLDFLSLSSPEFDPSGRNLFNYSKPKPTPEELEAMRKAQAEARRRAEEERERREEERKKRTEQAQKQALIREQGPPPPPPVTFRFVGYLGRPIDKIAVLEEGEDIYFGKEEEIVKEHFKIVKIDFDSVIIGYDKPEWQSKTKVLPLGKE